MILTDTQIQEYIDKEEIVITPFEKSQIQPATYDLRIGKYGATTTSKRKIDIEDSGYMIVKAGDFAVVETLETIKLGSQYAARFGLRSKFARKGLIATTGAQIDPGFEGKLILGLTNLTPKPISLSHKDDLVTVEFHRLDKPSSKPYQGPYQGKSGIGPEEIEFITESEGMALSEMHDMLRSLSSNVGEITHEFKAIKWLVGIILAFLALVVSIMAFTG